MIRAGVFIGVDRTGKLQELHDAAAGAQRMHAWALSQGMVDKTHAHLITDAGGGKVEPDQIFDAIALVLGGAGVDQLIVYFAGHGVNIGMSEHWLLSDAPVKRFAAVNVNGCVELAGNSAAQQIVFISDACRVAPEGIQAQRVAGVEVFPNHEIAGRRKPVSQFYACRLGSTAAEIKDPAVAAGSYSALYTEALLDALRGRQRDLFEPAAPADDGFLYLRAPRLATFLEAELPRRIKARGLLGQVNQAPEALPPGGIGDIWLSRWKADDLDVHTAAVPRAAPPAAAAAPEPPQAPPASELVREVMRNQMRLVTLGDPLAAKRLLEEAMRAVSAAERDAARQIETLQTPFGTDHFETQCGLKLRGARVVRAEAAQARLEVLSADTIRVLSLDGPGASVLLELDNGNGCVVPVLRGFITALTFDHDDLVDLACEPSSNDWRWGPYAGRADEIRALRAVAAAASRDGRFRLEAADAGALAQRMQYAKGIDPALAVYAAYAYRDLQADERIRQMEGYLQGDLGVRLFDVALLAGKLRGRSIVRAAQTVPCVPMLSQGWSLLSAHRVALHPALAGIEAHRLDSLWSLFDKQGVALLRRALQTQEVL